MHTTKTNLLIAAGVRSSVTLDIFLDYELQASSRYCRYVSVVMGKGVGDGSSQLQDMLFDSIRRCDAAFACGKYIAVLMGETDDHGSAMAIERYRRSMPGRGFTSHFASVTYPKDGRTVDELHSALWQRIEK